MLRKLEEIDLKDPKEYWKIINKLKGETDNTLIANPQKFECFFKDLFSTGNICKFYAWLELNDSTPIEVKLLVLDNCFFNSVLYGIEAWGDVECVASNSKSKFIDIWANTLRNPDMPKIEFYKKIKNEFTLEKKKIYLILGIVK